MKTVIEILFIVLVFCGCYDTQRRHGGGALMRWLAFAYAFAALAALVVMEVA